MELERLLSQKIAVILAMVQDSVHERHELEVKVPAGVDDGQQMRLQHQKGTLVRTVAQLEICILSSE